MEHADIWWATLAVVVLIFWVKRKGGACADCAQGKPCPGGAPTSTVGGA